MYAFKIYLWFIFVIFVFAFYQATYLLINPKIGWLGKITALLVIVYVIYLGFQRNTYLPFLGPTVLPFTLFPEELKPKDADLEFVIPVYEPDGTKVVYWASQPSKTIVENPFKAYADYRNVGITNVKNEMATMVVSCPSSYKVPGKTLKPHIHYRILYPTGIMGEVKTAYVNC